VVAARAVIPWEEGVEVAAEEVVVAEAEVVEHGSRGHQARNCASGA